MANASKFLDKRFKLADGSYRVRIRVTHERKSIYINTKYSFDEITYNKKIVSGKNMNNNEELLKAKKDLEAMEAKAADVINNLQVFSFHEFKVRFEQKGDRSDLVTLLAEQAAFLKSDGKFANASIFRYASDFFKAYAIFKFKTESFKISQVTPDELALVQKWAQSSKPGKANGFSITTISMYMVRVKRIMNNLIASGELNRNLYPFGDKLYQIPSSVNSKRPLTVDEIMLLYNYQPKTEVEEFAKSMFMFSYLCSGMNMADIFRLKHSDLGPDRFTFIRQKTKGKGKIKTLTVLLTPEIKEIIDRHKVLSLKSQYLFKVYNDKMSEEQKHKAKDVAIASINRSLKEIAGKIGITQSISTYFARHSYATVLMENGTPTAYISKKLGHSSLSTTEAYLGQFSKAKEESFEANLLRKA